MRILVVDDNPGLRDLLSCSLSYLGRCDQAENGLVAVDMYRQARAEHDPYILITMDCQMPVLDGFGAISMIRATEAAQKEPCFHSTICVISADDDCLERCEERRDTDDCLHCLQKPFLLADLDEIASIALRQTEASTSSFFNNQYLPEICSDSLSDQSRNIC
jgi:CheY-like chemotaxis protein